MIPRVGRSEGGIRISLLVRHYAPCPRSALAGEAGSLERLVAAVAGLDLDTRAG